MTGATEDYDNWLLFRVGPVGCAVPVTRVDRIILPPPHLTRLPGSNSASPGIFPLEDEPARVIDLRQKFGLEIPPGKPSGRMIMAHVGPALIAFWVDSIISLAHTGQISRAALPSGLPGRAFTGALFFQKDIILCSDWPHLMSLHESGPLRAWIEQTYGPLDEAAGESRPVEKDSGASIQGSRPRDESIISSEAPMSPSSMVTPTQEPAVPTTAPAAPPPASTARPIQHARPTTSAEKSGRPSLGRTPVHASPHKDLEAGRQGAANRAAMPRTGLPSASDQAPVHPHLGAPGKPAIEPPKPAQAITAPSLSGEAAPSTPTPQTPAWEEGEPGIPLAAIAALLLIGLSLLFWALDLHQALWTTASPPPLASHAPPAPRPEQAAPITPMPVMDSQPQPLVVEQQAEVPAPPPLETEDPVSMAQGDEGQPPLPAEAIATVLPELIPEREAASRGSVRIEEDEEGISIIFDAPPQDPAESGREQETAPEPPMEPATATEDDTLVSISPQELTVESRLETADEPEGVAADIDATEPATPALTPEAPPEPAPPAPPAPPREPQTIVHIVVKGDTLWHIARRYLNDPWYFKELAKLSNIKNPDLIYPGNKVRIIIR